MDGDFRTVRSGYFSARKYWAFSRCSMGTLPFLGRMGFTDCFSNFLVCFDNFGKATGKPECFLGASQYLLGRDPVYGYWSGELLDEANNKKQSHGENSAGVGVGRAVGIYNTAVF